MNKKHADIVGRNITGVKTSALHMERFVRNVEKRITRQMYAGAKGVMTIREANI